MPENDLKLLTDAAQGAGLIAAEFWGNEPKSWEKDAGAGPVSVADLAVNDFLHTTLTTARPDYGWLSEETTDSDERLSDDTLFIIDPIDGTRSFLAGEKTWAISVAVVHRGEPVAGVIYLPVLEKLYGATLGGGARLNGEPINASGRADINGATVLAARSNLDPTFWRQGPPPLVRHFRPSLAYRMALVAEGRFDAMLTLRPTWEWDVAAGTLIAQEAGTTVTNRHGAKPIFNNPNPQIAGLIAATGAVHSGIIGGLTDFPL